MKRVATKDNIRVPLSDQTNVIDMKKSGKSNVKVVKNPGRKLNVENEGSKRPKSKFRNAVVVENSKIKKTKPESVYESQLLNKELKVVPTDIQARKKELVNKRTIRPRSLCSCCIIDSKAKHTETHLNKDVDVKNTNQNKILEDLNQEKNNCLQQKVVIGKRIFRSRSQFCPAEDSSDVAEKANSAQKERVSKRTIRPKSLCSCCIIDSKAKHTETHLNEGVDVVKNANQIDTFSKVLKVVLTDFVVEKNMLRKRSKSLCEEKIPSQKMKPNKRNRAVSQCLDTENIEVILSKKVGTIQKNQPPKAVKAKHTETHLKEGVDVVKNTNQNKILEDLNQQKSKCLPQKVVISKRIFRSRSQLCPAEDSSNFAEKANSAQKERVNKRTIRPKSLCSCCIIDSKAKHTETHLNEGVDVVKNTNQIDTFGKALKVVLTDIVVEKNILRRRSKSLCEEKFPSQKMKPNKINRAVSQRLDTENIEVILPKKVGTIKKIQPPKAAKAKHTETHLNEGVDVVKNTNQIDTFGKALKVVLTDFVVEKNILRRRSKSLCEEKFPSQKMKPNKRNRAVSQFLDTENIEVILPKKVGAIQKNQPPKVTFCPEIEKGKEVHNLRRLQPKNYMEESILNCSADKPIEQLPGSDLKKKVRVPIYKKNLPEEQITQKEDLYEFTDSSPKAKKVTKNRRMYSSIFFDKDTYEILKKLEEKEAKAKKKIVRKKKKLEKEKSYGDIVNGIVENVIQKISKNKNPTTTTTQNNKVIHINNFEEEMNVIIHSSANVEANVPSTIKKTVPEVPKNVNTRKIEQVTNATSTTVKKPLSAVPKNVTTRNVEQVTNTAITTRKPAVNGEALFSNHSNILNMSDIDPILLQSIGSCDNSVSQKDIDSCFGFDIPSVPVTSTPAKLAVKNPINILNNVVLRRGIENMDSPVVDFNVKRPNANSTMVQTKGLQRASNPWRPDWVNLRYNPHFVSLKANSLPRLDQDMVLDHSLVEEFENSCSKTPRNRAETPAKKPSVQLSILNFVDSNIEQDNEVLQGSLYDYEAFISPEKKAPMKDKRRVQKIQRNILGDENDIVASTPAKRRPLADISNSSEETKEENTQNVTYFGFDESNEYIRAKTPEKRKKSPKNDSKENKEDNAAKPSRFNINTLRNYTKKYRAKEKEVNFDRNKSISIYEASSDDDAAEVHLFEEPEEMLDNMPPVCLEGKRQRRKRHDSYDSDSSECGKKRKKHKKTKLEIEQEEWIKGFNEMCCEIDKEVLELE